MLAFVAIFSLASLNACFASCQTTHNTELAACTTDVCKSTSLKKLDQCQEHCNNTAERLDGDD